MKNGILFCFFALMCLCACDSSRGGPVIKANRYRSFAAFREDALKFAKMDGMTSPAVVDIEGNEQFDSFTFMYYISGLCSHFPYHPDYDVICSRIHYPGSRAFAISGSDCFNFLAGPFEREAFKEEYEFVRYRYRYFELYRWDVDESLYLKSDDSYFRYPEYERFGYATESKSQLAIDEKTQILYDHTFMLVDPNNLSQEYFASVTYSANMSEERMMEYNTILLEAFRTQLTQEAS